MSSLVAMITVSLRRSRAAWPIVAAAGLICLLATTLLAAAPMYASAVSIAGLHRVVADAPVADANISVAYRVAPASADAFGATVEAELGRALGGVGGTIARFGRSDSFDLPGQPPGPRTDLVDIGFAEGIEDHASLVDGAWPLDAPDAAAGGPGPVPVAVSEQAAGPLSLSVGDELRLASRIEPSFVVPVRIVGVFRMRDAADPYWWGDQQVLDGVATSERYATHGPFFTTRANVLARATVNRTLLTWHAVPDVGALPLDGTGDLARRVEAIKPRIEAAAGVSGVTVATGLPAILARADRALLVSRTGVLILTLQFVVLAAYAVLLSAALLVEHRRVDTAMLRSRGAGPARIGVLALIEGLLLTVPAALAGPLVAAVALRAFNVAGPLADIGLPIAPVASADAFAAAALAAAACLVALLVPALPRVRSFSAVHGSLSRAKTTSIGNRLGFDIALLALAGLGLWQLRHYGAPLTRSVQGSLGIDPLLVATPAIGFLAGAIVALRIVPLLAGIIERITARGRGLVSSLGARQLARRPLRYTRAALLLMLAVSMGVFAITYTGTWTNSQRDQATYQVGADARVIPGRQVTSAPRWTLERTYAAMPGVSGHTPVDRESMSVAGADRSGQVVGLDAARAADIVRVRADLAPAPLSELLAPLAAGRPAPDLLVLPGQPQRLRLDLSLAIAALDGPGVDPVTGDAVAAPVDPATVAGRPGLETAVVVRDAGGGLYRFGGDIATIGGRQRVELPLGATVGGGTAAPAASFAYPLAVVAVEVTVRLPGDLEATDATLSIDRLAAAGADGAFTEVPMGVPRGWRVRGSVYGLPPAPVDAGLTGDTLSVATGVAGLDTIRGVDAFGRGTRLSFVAADIVDAADGPAPALASTAFLAATARAVGDDATVSIGGTSRTVRIVGAVRAFPTVEAASPAIVMDLPTLALLRFDASAAVDPADEWWIAMDGQDVDATVARLRDPAIGSAEVVSVADRTRALAADPVALGVIGVLGIGVAAAALFAIVGFVASAAVAARERVTEFALLRALGLSSGQLSGWLSLENAALALISLAAGTALGLLVAWVALPFVTVTQDAVAPFPPVEVAVPWPTIGALVAVALVALGLAVVGLAWLLRRVGLASALRSGED
jgi:hypothetical protein